MVLGDDRKEKGRRRMAYLRGACTKCEQCEGFGRRKEQLYFEGVGWNP